MRLALCVMIALCALSCSAYATTVYTDETTFLAAIAPGYYLENFGTFSDGDPLGGDPSPTSYDSPAVNGFSWTASAASGLWSLYHGMSAAYPFEPLVITFTGASVTAVGGTFSATDYVGDAIANASVLVSLADGTSQTVASSGFVGFKTTSAIASLQILPAAAAEGNWAAFTRFYAGSASSGATEPEPSSLMAVAMGLLGLGSTAIRRRARRQGPSIS